MILRQTFEQPVSSIMFGGPHKSFDWTIDSQPKEDKKGLFVRVGSFSANYWFHVSLGKTIKQTLGRAKTHLETITKVPCTFEYIDSEPTYFEKLCLGQNLKK